VSKISSAALAIILAISASPSYFKYRRQIQSTNSAGQHYIVVDEALWRHARPDLHDLRMYAAEKEVPYKMTVETGGSETEQKQFRVLQPASIGGKTQFLLDMSGVDEYDRIHLTLATKKLCRSCSRGRSGRSTRNQMGSSRNYHALRPLRGKTWLQ